MPRTKTTRVGNGNQVLGSKGDGWGGPAKGVGSDKPKASVDKLIPGQPEFKVLNSAEKAALRTERVFKMEAMLFTLAESAEREETKVSAIKALHAIYEGQPIARQLTAHVDDIGKLNDDELRAELARHGGISPEAASGDSPKGMPH